jgi:biopolymer transport protein TolR
MPGVMKGGGSSNGGGRGRRGRGMAVSSSLAEINVVPLVDVMLVLLIIFMVAAPMMQQGISVNLPQSRRSPALPANNEPIYVTVPLAFANNRVVQIGNESVRIEVLRERVRQLIEPRSVKEVFLRADGGVTVQQVMEVMDRLKEGGVEKVGMVTQPASSAAPAPAGGGRRR